MSKLDELIDDTRRNAIWFEKNKYSKKPVNYDIGSPAKVTKERIKHLVLDKVPKKVNPYDYSYEDSAQDFMLGYVQACLEISKKVEEL